MQFNPELSLIDKKNTELRKNPRLNVDLGTSIEFRLQDDGLQKPYKAFITDMSMSGCGIKILNNDAKMIQKNSVCYINDPKTSHILTKVKVIWIKKTENNTLRIGLEYMDDY